MNGQDLINYIKKHHLEEAELDIGISDPLQFVVTVPQVQASERELVYDFTRDFVYDRYLCTNQISYEEAEKMRDLDLKGDAEVLDKARASSPCINCGKDPDICNGCDKFTEWLRSTIKKET